ncbi:MULTISPECIES: hypothetical protein [Actinoplanes]|uniref:hypothetical protein n=1 Tax=Actinoplanes TaxID=1865 RepID=UPI001FE23444|nr:MULTISPECIES: hypothetical protein [Actinoplanes]GLY01665.1 hypothetical protein Acsp01_20440 [Actinoplanes sp. NBRC 101535]
MVTFALLLGVVPGAAHAAPKTTKPTAIKIDGKEIAEEIMVQEEAQPRLFQMLFSEVGWLSAAKPQTTAPKSSELGPKYTVTLLVKESPSQVYDLYPLATGGPRAYRPAKQPSGKKTAGWFYGRLSMSEALRLGGAPLEAKPDVVNGGIGGGFGEDIKAVDPMDTVNDAFTEFRQLFLLNGAVLLAIMVGLAGMAFLIRRRI